MDTTRWNLRTLSKSEAIEAYEKVRNEQISQTDWAKNMLSIPAKTRGMSTLDLNRDLKVTSKVAANLSLMLDEIRAAPDDAMFQVPDDIVIIALGYKPSKTFGVGRV